MEVEASFKVPEGKMVKINAEVEGEKIKDAEIRGDFFLEPPEKLSELEEKISGLPKQVSNQRILEELEKVDADLIGFSREDIAKALEKAIEGEEP